MVSPFFFIEWKILLAHSSNGNDVSDKSKFMRRSTRIFKCNLSAIKVKILMHGMGVCFKHIFKWKNIWTHSNEWGLRLFQVKKRVQFWDSNSRVKLIQLDGGVSICAESTHKAVIIHLIEDIDNFGHPPKSPVKSK